MIPRSPSPHLSTYQKIQSLVLESYESSGMILPLGSALSIGDCKDCGSSENDLLISMKNLNRIIDFDSDRGVLSLEAGATIEDAMRTLDGSIWSLKVTPSFKGVSIGGALSSDVFGFNHSMFGSFSDSVLSFSFLGADGNKKTVHKGEPLFNAVCGGYGLMGIIQEVTLSLRKADSLFMDTHISHRGNLEEFFTGLNMGAFEFRKGSLSFSRLDGVVSLGDFCRKEETVGFLDRTLNQADLKIRDFNLTNKLRKSLATGLKSIYLDLLPKKRKIPSSVFMFRDNLFSEGESHLHFLLPFDNSIHNLGLVIDKIKESGKTPFDDIEVRLLGCSNKVFLSFPSPGYSINIRFPKEKHLSPLFSRLSQLISSFSGKIYIVKDYHSKGTPLLDRYPASPDFHIFRSFNQWGDGEVGPKEVFGSSFSKRVGV